MVGGGLGRGVVTSSSRLPPRPRTRPPRSPDSPYALRDCYESAPCSLYTALSYIYRILNCTDAYYIFYIRSTSLATYPLPLARYLLLPVPVILPSSPVSTHPIRRTRHVPQIAVYSDDDYSGLSIVMHPTMPTCRRRPVPILFRPRYSYPLVGSRPCLATESVRLAATATAWQASEPARLAASAPQIWQATEAATALLRF